jgi:hypothetical protein
LRTGSASYGRKNHQTTDKDEANEKIAFAWSWSSY